MNLNNVIDNFKGNKALLDKHINDVHEYRKSYNAATDFIQRIMKDYVSAREFTETIPYIESSFFEQQLIASELCPNKLTRKLLRETACRLIDYGCVSAKVYKYEKSNYYIILDTGTIDFFSNMACLIFAVFEQENGQYNYDLDEQAIVSLLWSLSFIYYDFGLKTNNEALLFPHFRYHKLNKIAQPYAKFLSMVGTNFFIFHEFGHIVDDELSESSQKEENEFSADFFAFTALRESSFATFDHAKAEFTIIGCIFALASIDFIESTFPNIEYTRGHKKCKFPELSSDYPSSKLRLQKLLENFPSSAISRLKSHKFYISMTDTFTKYSDLIKKGSRPTPEYWEFQENKLSSHKNGNTINIYKIINDYKMAIAEHEEYLYGVSLYGAGLKFIESKGVFKKLLNKKIIVNEENVPFMNDFYQVQRKAINEAVQILNEVITAPYEKLNRISDIRLPSIKGQPALDKLHEIVTSVLNTYNDFYQTKKYQFSRDEFKILMDKVFNNLPPI